MVEQKTREIGIRKVLGATTGSLVGLLSKDFIRLVLIAFLIAIPSSYLFLNKWLERFAYQVDTNFTSVQNKFMFLKQALTINDLDL